MAFHVYPDPQINPLSVGAGLTSPLVPIVELASLINPSDPFTTMFIRIVMLGSGCAPSGAAAPTIKLKADTGVESDPVPNNPFTVIIRNGANIEVANATMIAEANDVFLVKVFIFSAGSSWQIRIGNNDGVNPHSFTWVVASADTEAKQPWIDAPTELGFGTLGDILVGDSVTHTLSIPNKGTGALQINDTTMTPLGAGFKIVDPLPGLIQPNACGDIKITFDAPATVGEKTFDYTIDNTDGLATISAGHNKRVSLKATVRKLEVVVVLDGSGSMAFTPDGTKFLPDMPLIESRWGQAEIAAEQFLDLLQSFAGSKGTIAIVEFPDISQTPIPDISARVVQSSIPIPADVTSLKNLLKQPNPIPRAGIGNTPMGHGIGEAMGTIAGSYGQFDNGPNKELSKSTNLRWMVVLSDGAHNRGASGTSDHPNFYYGTGPTSFKGKNIKVFAAAYGDPKAVNWLPDPMQMQSLATESAGVNSDAGPNDLNIDQITKAFRNAITDTLALDPVVDPGGTLTISKPEARYAISVLPYDTKVAFVINWRTLDAERVSVQLLTPNCELITPGVAREDSNLSYDGHPRYAIYTIQHDYLRNANDPSRPRYGTWTLLIISNGLEEGDSETYEFEVITQSRLKMELKFNHERYFTGDPIELSARLTLDGKPIKNASVYWTLDAPGDSIDNWLALSKVSDAEYKRAAEEFSGDDVTRLTIKRYALTKKGIQFPYLKYDNTTTMTDPQNQGIYSASNSRTNVPGTYTFRVTALGTTEDGTQFRRERQVQIYLSVRPRADFILWEIIYQRVLVDERPGIEAVVRVLPRDQFGNVVLVEPEFNPIINVTAKGGEFAGPLAGNLDGSYTRSLRYSPEITPTIGLEVAGETVVPTLPLAPVAHLQYVDQVIDFKPGGEAEKGANQHTDPRAALGAILEKKPDEFVSLGAYGSLAVGIQGQSILTLGDNDITVFIQPDEDLRPYSVEVMPAGKQDTWVLLGKSAGTTQSFSLEQAGLKAAEAIRITDASGRMRDSEFKPSATPGVSILGVGILDAGINKAGEENVGCQYCPKPLRKFLCRICQFLKRLRRS